MVLWVGFAGVHAVLVVLALRRGGAALSDVTQVYEPWARQALAGHGAVGIDQPWVYPVLALVPVLVPAVAGASHYLTGWLVMVTVVDAAALAVLIHRRRPGDLLAGWWWLIFLLLLGPVAIGRLDTVAAALAVAAVSLVASRPATGQLLLSAAMWVKVWPVAVVAAAVSALPGRRRAVAAVAAFSAALVAVVAALGGGANLFSFVTAQSSRELQVEAPVSTWWMWAAMPRGSTTHISFDTALRTVQVRGPGTGVAGAVTTALMPVAVLALVLLGVVAARRHRTEVTFPALAIALTLTLLVVDKVGSPQYLTWLAAPVVAGLTLDPARTRVYAVLTWATAALTDMLYPYLSARLRSDDLVAVAVLTARNALLVVMLVIAVGAVTGLAASAWRHPVRATGPSDAGATTDRQ